MVKKHAINAVSDNSLSSIKRKRDDSINRASVWERNSSWLNREDNSDSWRGIIFEIRMRTPTSMNSGQTIFENG